jgi:lysosomal acid lipase/cholesteryl ester hydrolase
MEGVPLIGRLSAQEYVALIFGFFFIAFEGIHRSVKYLLPKPIISWFDVRSRALLHYFSSAGRRTREPASEHQTRYDRIRTAGDFEELCEIFGYVHEEHVVLTKDGYLLGVHRLPTKEGKKMACPGMSMGKPVVYLHHGLLMNSEVWVCLTEAERSLPFMLVKNGASRDPFHPFIKWANIY